jgi:prepilin signal peptidase PulO-like enzyme (type II secretory pathway)
MNKLLMFTCPYCGKRGISLWKKLLINSSTAFKGRCAICGEYVTIQYYFVIFSSACAVVATVFLARYFHFDWIQYKIALIIIIIIEIINLFFIPLVKRK